MIKINHVIKRGIVFFGIFIICNIALFSFFKPSVELLIESNSDNATLNFFYDNNETVNYPFDDSHMITVDSLKGFKKQKILINIPTEKLNKLRIDLGTEPASFKIHSFSILRSPLTESRLRGEHFIEKFDGINDISKYEVVNEAVEISTSGSDGYIYSLNLNNNLSTSIRQDFYYFQLLFIAISVVLAYAKPILFIFKKNISILFKQLIKSKNIIMNGKSRTEKAAGFGLIIFYSVLFSIILDIFIFRFITIISGKLGLDTIYRFFAPALSFSLGRIYFFFLLFFIVGLCLYLGAKRLIRYRYYIAFLFFILMVLGRFTGSSLGFYDGMLNGNTPNYERSTLLGIPQGIRGDEWATEKPYYFAQIMGEEALPYFNKNLSFDGNDMVISAFSPVKDIIILARPDLWGFLFLSGEYAFSFYWCLRLVLLFMASFEMGYLLTKRYRYASLAAIIITFAPPVQWWLSQTLMLMLMSGQFAIVLFDKYLKSSKRHIQALTLLGVGFFALIYTLTMYPATQVPLAYIFLSILIYVCIDNKKRRPLAPSRIIQYFFAMLPFVGILIHFYIKSSPALRTMMNTIYPGSNRPWIPLPWDYDLYQFVNVFTASIRQPDFLNASEISQFFSFIPFLFLLMVIVIINRPKKILLPVLLFSASFFLWIVSWLPQMEFFNKITLLSFTYPVRITYAYGFGFTLLLISILPLLENRKGMYSTKKASIVSGAICFITLCVLTNSENIMGYFMAFKLGTIVMILTVILFSYLGYLILKGGTKKVRQLSVILVLLTGASTLMVNPITQGLDSMFEKSTMTKIREIDNEDSGRWMVSGSPTISNLVTAQGVARTTGTYYYPDWEMMNIIDKKHEFVDLWNQFAHIDMRLTDKDLEFSIFDHEKSAKVDGTNRIIYIPIETARELKVKYIFTMIPLPVSIINSGEVTLIYSDEVDPWSIYRVNY
ncbi:DUF7657 domain-containing protein [Paenibacillus lautus]|uniref:DUF7657 domain-containing protein n=1 Tax=Paenibacillus lautus TaxID=1401 RepID=UPI003D2D5ACE